MRCRKLFIIGVLIVCFGCKKKSGQESTAYPPTDRPEWVLDFEENFDGGAVDESRWDIYRGPGHAGNGLRSAEAFSIENGVLVVTAAMKNGVLVSGGMANKQNLTYGKFEFRVRNEPDSSEATSGVVLTWPQSERWPVDGENDIFETGTGASRNPFHTFIHYSADNQQYHYAHEANGTEWQIISMEWTKEKIIISRNGKIVWTLTDAAAIPDVPHHLCIQLDAFKTVMTGTVRMYVDWVKIYQ
jgi:endo-1,3-1,4-beta-glycanase ExoK